MFVCLFVCITVRVIMSEVAVLSIHTFPNLYCLYLIPPNTTINGFKYTELLKEKLKLGMTEFHEYLCLRSLPRHSAALNKVATACIHN